MDLTCQMHCPTLIPEPNTEQGWSRLPKPNMKLDHPVLNIRNKIIPSHYVPNQAYG
ncbi:hypothetical protein BDA96_06G117000 [Sorghum bicolor]|uniref:Uncharacterized protein n=2 Tax=Sorghum bicolor TaxID=4558 RepID=A0A1Z5RDX3_SORBI|nr:hypothetical protein BDA96_06G117000 [Sorghum bicolor]OQU81701.1 hypothetical protein SORBI_3006G105750 [Sorghum bicolor]OQU81702.1 hypothetical protein SORBI_3006G105750 [Sorghum bicolor]OQU81703.1 hypothetical protein SORBI_3006G105750 [Sorghum bicolor]OQU81704.1 hypothetical protein SORBI_3006G105750 [Sorghum bicolor]